MYSHVPMKLKGDKDIVLAVIRCKDGGLRKLQCLPRESLRDRDIILAVLDRRMNIRMTLYNYDDSKVMKSIKKGLKDLLCSDRNLVINLLKKEWNSSDNGGGFGNDPYIFMKYIPDMYRDDLDLMSIAVQAKGDLLAEASDRLRSSRELVELACSNDPRAFKLSQ